MIAPCDQGMMQSYRNVFGTSEGRVVLNDLMDRLGLIQPAQTDEKRIRHKVACEILTCCGVYGIDFSAMFNQTTDWERVFYGE
jgi:hypothetical protein